MTNKRLQTVFLNLFFPVQSKKLLNFQLNRESMSIPSCLTRYLVSLHRAVSWNHILDNSCQHMTDVRFSICCRRTIIKCIRLSFFAMFHTLFENIIFFPKLFCFLLTLYEIQICRYFLIHDLSSFPEFSFMSSLFRHLLQCAFALRRIYLRKTKSRFHPCKRTKSAVTTS